MKKLTAIIASIMVPFISYGKEIKEKNKEISLSEKLVKEGIMSSSSVVIKDSGKTGGGGIGPSKQK